MEQTEMNNQDKTIQAVAMVKKRIDQSLQGLSKYHCPIIGAGNRDEPVGIGSAVVLMMGNRCFLASAAHVFDENSETTLHTVVNSEIVKLIGTVYKTTCFGIRQNDKVDISIFEVTNNLEEFLKTYNAVTLDQIDATSIPNSKHYYAFIGYPSTKTKPIYGTNKFRAEIFSYGDFIAPHEDSKALGFDPFFHIVIRFERKKCLSSSGQRTIFPDPHGMSGGGVWLLEDFNHPTKSSSINKLVGIGIEYYQKDIKVLVGVNIGAIIEAVKYFFPDLNIVFPTTRFKIHPPSTTVT